MATRRELIEELQKRGIDNIWGNSLTSAAKDELEYFHRVTSEGSPLRHLSFTQVSTYLTCGLRYYWRYVKGLKRPPSFALTLGSAYDTSVNAQLTTKMAGSRLSEDDAVTAFVEDLALRKEETEWSLEETAKLAEQQGRKVVKAYRDKIEPVIEPITIQEKYDITFDNADFTLMIITDVEASDGVHDNKTTGRYPSQMAKFIEKDLQLTAYTAGVMQKRGLEALPQGWWDVAYRVSGKVATLAGNRTKDDVRRFLGIVQRIAEGIRRGVFVPCEPMTWCCQEKWCGYFKMCQKEI